MEVLLSHKAQKYLNRISEPSKSVVFNALNKREREPQEGNIKPIAGQKGFGGRRLGIYVFYIQPMKARFLLRTSFLEDKHTIRRSGKDERYENRHAAGITPFY
jgi:hypothetical protein